jgi:hypothetical protein
MGKIIKEKKKKPYRTNSNDWQKRPQDLVNTPRKLPHEKFN